MCLVHHQTKPPIMTCQLYLKDHLFNLKKVKVFVTCDSQGYYIDLAVIPNEDIIKTYPVEGDDGWADISICEYWDKDRNKDQFFYMEEL